MATSSSTVRQVQTQKSDPLVRGFDQERMNQQQQQNNTTIMTTYWGRRNGGGKQDRNYKFIRIQSCTWQSFGHRPTDQTPHAFDAQRLLEKLVTDPGIIAIMKERNLVVNTLGEMDPIDDPIMQKKQKESGHALLLGYNTNSGLQIDIKLRTEDLSSFRPYSDLVSTLIHELSHNWVSDHSIVFWTNYAQMKAQYLYHHYYEQSYKVNGRTTAELAGIGSLFDGVGSTSSNSTEESPTTRIYSIIMNELKREMSQHQLHPNMIQGPIQFRCQELDEMYVNAMGTTGQRLGGIKVSNSNDTSHVRTTTTSSTQNGNGMTARDKALAAAERRRHKRQQHQGKEL